MNELSGSRLSSNNLTKSPKSSSRIGGTKARVLGLVMMALTTCLNTNPVLAQENHRTVNSGKKFSLEQKNMTEARQMFNDIFKMIADKGGLKHDVRFRSDKQGVLSIMASVSNSNDFDAENPGKTFYLKVKHYDTETGQENNHEINLIIVLDKDGGVFGCKIEAGSPDLDDDIQAWDRLGPVESVECLEGIGMFLVGNGNVLQARSDYR